MKLMMDSWLRAWLRAATVALVCLAAAAALGQAPSTTTVTGTVYLANGLPGAGTLVLSWPSFTTAAGQLVVADSTTVTIPSDGFVSVNLVANQGSTPAGEYYTAVFYMSDGSTHTQYWVVPAAASATLAAVQSQVMPAAQALQAVSKAYVDEAIAELAGSGITSSGGSLTGPLYLNGDPTVPLQAADKHYVDTSFSQALPLSGGALTGPLTVSGTAQTSGTMMVRNNADAEVDYNLWPGLTASQKGSFTYKDWNGNSQWSLLKDASNNWVLNSAVGGLDSFKAYQSTNSGDTYIDASNSTGHIRLNYESGSGAETDIYAGSSSSLVAAFLGTTSIRFPGLAASSGSNCLQIDNAGNVSNTGAACGAGSGSGTVNSGTTNQVAIYTAPGNAVSGSNSLSLSGAMSAAGVQDALRPWVDTFMVSSASSTCGSGTDEFAKLCQLDVNAAGTYTGNIERSTGVSGGTVTGSVSPFAPYLTAIPFVGTLTNSIKKLAPGTVYTVPGELDIPSGGEIDGQSTYQYYGTPRTGTWLEAANTFPFAPASSLAGNVLINMGNLSSTSSGTLSLYNKLHNIGIDGLSYPWSTCIEEGQSQQGMELHDLFVRDCTFGLNVDNFSNGQGGAQNHGPIYKNNFTLAPMPSSMYVTSIIVTAGGSYTQAPAVTVSGCTTNPLATSTLTGSAVTGVALVNTGGAGYGATCTPGSVTVSFDTTYGSGATAVPVIQLPPSPIGMRLGGIHGSGGGLYWTNGVVGSNYATNTGTGMTLDNSQETILDQYGESAATTMCVGCNTSNLLFGNTVIGLRAQGSNQPVQTALQLGVSTNSTNVGQFDIASISGSGVRDWIVDNNVNGGVCRNDLANVGGVARYIRSGTKVFSMCRGIATTGLVEANAFYNCGSCTTANEPRQYLPGKLAGGYIQSMALSDTSQPIGIGTNGNFDTTNTHRSDFAFQGQAPCIFDPSVTVNVGDLVGVSANTVVSGQSIAGCLDMSTSSFPVSGYTGWLLGSVVAFNGTDGAITIPSAPSVGSATVTPSTAGAITYSYQLTAATAQDKTESAPSSTLTTTTGPGSLIANAKNTIAGLTSGVYNLYRTAMGSSSLPSLTAVMAGGALAEVTGLPGSTSGYTFAPTAAFSGGSCTTEPSIILYVSAGQIYGYHIVSPGSGCTGTPTIALTKSTCETGWIAQFSGTAVADSGYCGDGTSPPSSGILAPLVNLAIQYNGTPGTGNVNGPGSSTSNDLAAFNGTSGATIKDSGVPSADLTSSVAPLWLQYLGTGVDGAESCTSGTCALSGEKFYTTFNVSSGAVVTASSALIVHATGACTINGLIAASGATNALANAGGLAGGSSGGSGGGTSAGTNGVASFVGISLTGTSAVGANAGSAGAASGGSGTNGAQFSTSVQRMVATTGLGLDGFDFTGANSVAGANSGGAAVKGGASVTLMCASITGTGTIDASGAPGNPPNANSEGASSGGGGGVVILNSVAPETYTLNIFTGGGAGGQVSVPYAVAMPTSSTASGNAGTVPPVLAMGVTSGALSSCTVTQAGAGLGSSPSLNFAIVGGGGTGGTITPTYSGGTVASCTASGGSGYTAATYTTAGAGGYGGAGWFAEFSGR